MNWQEFPALFVLATAMSFTTGPNTTLSTALAAEIRKMRVSTYENTQ